MRCHFASLSRKLYRDMVRDLATIVAARKPDCCRHPPPCVHFVAAAQARLSCRARLRIAFSRSVSTCLAIVVSTHWPFSERTCRSTVTVNESECRARDRMNTLIRYCSFGLPGGEYQSVTIEPVSGSSDVYLTKSSVSCAACHRIGLTVLPVNGPGSFTDSFLARPRIVQMVASVSISSGSFDAVCCGAPVLGGALDCSGGAFAEQAARTSKKLAANAAAER